MNEKEMDDVGFRFHPYEEELINHYLKRKVLHLDTNVSQPIAEVNVLNFEPWDLPEFSLIKSNGPYWYFFSQLDYKYLNSTRANRTTRTGYWKTTGKDREVKSRDTKKPIGSKKTLVFISKKVKNHSTKWVIHEYHVPEDVPNPNNYVICRLEKKADGKANTSTHVEGESSGQSPSDIVNHVAENMVLEGEGGCLVDPLSQANLEEINCCLALLSQFYTEGLSYQDLPLPNGFSSHYNVLQTQFDTTHPEEYFTLLDSNLNNERKAYPVETIIHENGGMSSDTNNEVVIAQAREATEHVTANEHEVKSEWASFFIQ